ncbi:hypothetical protein N7488_012333 [Penicillium malachiteum]|nr:hypothetical protein N7488_012333 [Penicillium malachiteum]
MPPAGVKPPYIHDWNAAANEPVDCEDEEYTWYNPDWAKSQTKNNYHYHREGDPPRRDNSDNICD